MTKEKWLKIGRYTMLLGGFYLIFIAPAQFSTIPSGLYWLGVVLIVGFVAWNVFTAWREYYHKECKKGWRNKRKAVIVGVAIIVLSVALFAGLKFSGLSERLFPGYYGQF